MTLAGEIAASLEFAFLADRIFQSQTGSNLIDTQAVTNPATVLNKNTTFLQISSWVKLSLPKLIITGRENAV